MTLLDAGFHPTGFDHLGINYGIIDDTTRVDVAPPAIPALGVLAINGETVPDWGTTGSDCEPDHCENHSLSDEVNSTPVKCGEPLI